jgi:S1-C subfamily serine protease
MTVVLVAPNGPAAVAGLEPRDVILSVNGRPVKDYASLRPALGAYAPGKTVALRVRRGGKEFDADAKLQNISSAPTAAPQ